MTLAKKQDKKAHGLMRRLGMGLLKVVAVAVALYLLLPYLGLRITRGVRSPIMRGARSQITLAGSELERSQAAITRTKGPATRPVNVIIFVADGLGFAHLSAARASLHGMGGSAEWDRFTTTGWHQPHTATGFLVDSAASATALATGEPTHGDYIGVDTELAPLPNLFERGSELGYRSGVVTDSYIWDATPAAFVTHAASRDDAASILEQLADSSVEILVGELEDLGENQVPTRETTIEILERRFRVFGSDTRSTEDFIRQGRHGGPVAAIFEEDQITDLQSTPNLPQLLRVALERLASDERPILLLVESEEADSASHAADFDRLLRGMEAIEAALELVLDFADRNEETLVVFTSDHETGGLALSAGGSTNSSMRALWSTPDHSGVVVPVLARGPGSELFDGSHSTWEIGRLLGEMMVKPTAAPTTEP